MSQKTTEYPFNIIARSEWEERVNGSILQSFTVYACFVGEWNPDMSSQSKLDPFSCVVVHGPKKCTTSCLGRVQHLKEKSRAKNFFAMVNRGKFIYAKKKLGVSSTLNKELTPMMPGERYFQHMRKYILGRWPIMFSISVENCSIPLNETSNRNKKQINNY